MSVSKQKGSNRKTGLCKAAISGDMTIYTAEEIKTALNDLIDEYSRFEFDLSEVEEIDSSGVQILMAFAAYVRKKEHSFLIKSSADEVSKIITNYRLEAMLNET